MKTVLPVHLASVAGFAVMIVAGCGGRASVPDLVPVHGVVTLDGLPLADAMVEFRPELGRSSSGRTDANGKYQLRYTADIAGALPGRHTVMIMSAPEGDEDPTDRLKDPRIPAKYNSKTKLDANLEPGKKADLDFNLESDPKTIGKK